MTAFDTLRYQHVLERWRVLAERRLEHMTELYETGRWRHYFSEEKFLGIVRETRASLDAWERLAPKNTLADQLAAALTRTEGEKVPPKNPFADQLAAAMTMAEAIRTRTPPSPFTQQSAA